MLGSNITIRLAVGMPHIYARSFALARPVTLLPNLPFRSQRSYATPGRPRTAVGEPTKTVKRAVKRTAANKDPEATTPKKPAKKAPKKPVKEPTEEDKARAKAKAEKEIARANLKADKAKQQQLEELALPTPKGLVASPKMTAWTAYSGERVHERFSGTHGQQADLSSVVKELARNYKDLPAAQREHYNHVAIETNKQKAEEYKEWVESHTPAQIHQANLARRKLRAQSPQKAKLKKYRNITDERVVKKPPGSYAIFLGERMSSGDFKGIGGGRQGTQLIADEWKALTDGEKQKYIDSAAKLKEEYNTRQAALDTTS